MPQLQRANVAAQLPEATRLDVPGCFIRAVFVASELRRNGEVYYRSEADWERAKVHLLLELDLRLEDTSNVQKLNLCTVQDLEGVPQDLIFTSTLRLQNDETVVGSS